MRNKTRPLLWLAAAVLLVSTAVAPARAQEAPQAEPAAKPKTEVIPTAEIPARADADEQFARETLARAQKAPPTARLEQQLQTIEAGIARLSGRIKDTDLSKLPALRLDSFERHWKFYDVQLSEWRKELQRVTVPYTDADDQISKRRAAWDDTRAAGVLGGATPALVQRVDQVTAQLERADQSLSQPLAALIRLGSKASALQGAVRAGIKATSAAIQYQDSRLLVRDAAPLWDAAHEPRSADVVQGALTGLQIERDFMREYDAANAHRQAIYRIGAILLLPLMIWLSRRSRKLVSDDTELAGSANVLLRPISAWLVLVLVGVVVTDPDGPLLPQQAALLVALIPVLRLLPREVFATLGPWPYIGTALYLLDRMGFLLMGHPFWQRIHLLVVTVLALSTLVWLLLRSARRPDEEPRARIAAAARFVGWLASFALLVSLIANLIGNASLAMMLTNATLDSGYIGLALYAGATVLAAIVKLLFARRQISSLHIVRQHTGPLLGSVSKLIKTAALVLWVLITLNEFRILRPLTASLRSVLGYPLEIGEITLTLGNIVLFVLAVYVSFWLAKTIRVVLAEEVLPNMSLPRGVGNSVSTLTYYGVVLLGFIAALAVAGFEVGQFAIVAGALGVGIGFGLQNVVNNFVSGLILMFERPIQPGDVVEVTGTSGRVREIGMRATTLSTFEGADVVVPNGSLLSEKLINWTLSDMNRRLDVNVGVAYGTDPKRVLELLLDVARSTQGVAADPEPVAIFVGFGTSSLDFTLRAWTNNYAEWVSIRSNLTVRVHDAIVGAGIEIPFPQQDLHLRSVSPEVRAGLTGSGTPSST
jgi:small-conductance mechanosensitive channel